MRCLVYSLSFASVAALAATSAWVVPSLLTNKPETVQQPLASVQPEKTASRKIARKRLPIRQQAQMTYRNFKQVSSHSELLWPCLTPRSPQDNIPSALVSQQALDLYRRFGRHAEWLRRSSNPTAPDAHKSTKTT